MMVRTCSVPDCLSNTDDSELSFHEFPKNEKRRKDWLNAILPGKHHDAKAVKQKTLVCSHHFSLRDFAVGRHPDTRERRRLRANAVPSLNLKLAQETENSVDVQTACPSKIKQTANLDHSDHSIKAEQETPQVGLISKPLSGTSSSENTLGSPAHVSEVEEICLTSPSSSSVFSSLPTTTPMKIGKKASVDLLATTMIPKFSLLRFITSDADIKYYTGFQNYQMLYAFYMSLEPYCKNLGYLGKETEKRQKTANKPVGSLNKFEELFLTLVRLRKGLPEKVIADLYNLSVGHVSRTIKTWILFLADRLSYLHNWPSKEHLESSIPNHLKESLKGVRIIIDCTELFLEMPSASHSQRETFSSYKHHNTAKALIGIAPSGQIIFFSELYTGRCSEKKIFRHCGILDKLSPGDIVMADKGFDIAEDLLRRGMELQIPDFLMSEQSTEAEFIRSKKIASTRVHVERAVHKIKEFRILANTIPITLTPLLGSIWYVCCHLANFTGELIAEKEDSTAARSASSEQYDIVQGTEKPM